MKDEKQLEDVIAALHKAYEDTFGENLAPAEIRKWLIAETKKRKHYCIDNRLAHLSDEEIVLLGKMKLGSD